MFPGEHPVLLMMLSDRIEFAVRSVVRLCTISYEICSYCIDEGKNRITLVANDDAKRRACQRDGRFRSSEIG